MSKSLEESREQARADLDRLDRLIEIKEFLTQKLTLENGKVIDTQLEFELDTLKISIKKARTRNAKGAEASETKSNKRSGKKRAKREPKQLKPAEIKKIDALSFTGLKKKAAIALIQQSVSSFSDAHWDSFRESFETKLVGEGQGAGRMWTFNA
jgi:hypothetical protein